MKQSKTLRTVVYIINFYGQEAVDRANPAFWRVGKSKSRTGLRTVEILLSGVDELRKCYALTVRVTMTSHGNYVSDSWMKAKGVKMEHVSQMTATWTENE